MSRTVLLLASAALAVLLASWVALVGLEEPAVASFPGTNGPIAFAYVEEDAGGAILSDIYRMRPDGSHKRNLSQGPYYTYHGDPNWSADGEKIVFSGIVNAEECNLFGDDCIYDIFWMNADGSGATNLTNSAADECDPAFFPDHHRIVFVRNRDIYEMTVDDNGNPLVETQLTTSPAEDAAPAVAPDGERIAFVRGRKLYVMRAEPESATNTPVRLTPDRVVDTEPDWSPSGTRLAFSSNRSGNYEIWKMKPKPRSSTNRPVKLTDNGLDDAWPTWSPDGKKIAFAKEDGDGSWNIFKKYSDGTGPALNLTEGKCGGNFRYSCVEPSWRPAP